MNKLKACPFCGATESGDESARLEMRIELEQDKSIRANVDCTGCGVTFNYGTFGSGFTTKEVMENITNQFNTRN